VTKTGNVSKRTKKRASEVPAEPAAPVVTAASTEVAELAETPAPAASAGGDRADWGIPRPATIPAPTYFPAATAFGATFFLWGLITSPVVLVAGLVVLVVSIVGWIGEMRRDQ
jgi:hypothetical protein